MCARSDIPKSRKTWV